MKNMCISIATLLSCFFINAADHLQNTPDDLDDIVLIDNMSFYQYLGVSENATNTEIKRASQKKLKNTGHHMIAKYKLGSKSKTTRETLKDWLSEENSLIKHVEAILLNKSKRAEYDQDLNDYRIEERRKAQQQKKAVDRS